MAATGHALLGPSSSHRWLNCTPSAKLEENVKDKGSDFAQEGSCAHALCEEKLWRLLGSEDAASAAVLEQAENNRQKWYSNEMENCAEDYAAAVWNKFQEALKATPDAKLFIERQLNFEKFIPHSFGTADAIIIADGTMEVIDFKYGKGVEVSAAQNPQMMIYALGAIEEFELDYNIENVRMTIIQPRLSNYSEYEITTAGLIQWCDQVLMPKAALAWEGKGEQTPGEWCKFCKIKATCGKLASQALSVYTQNEVKEQIAIDDYPAILSLIPAIKSWCSAVEDYATAKAIDGQEFKGYKLVEGRSIRKIVNEGDLIVSLAQAGYEDIFKKPELKSIGELEKQIGKKEFFALTKDYIEKPKGKPTLVPDTDKRPAINTSSALEDFASFLDT